MIAQLVLLFVGSGDRFLLGMEGPPLTLLPQGLRLNCRRPMNTRSSCFRALQIPSTTIRRAETRSKDFSQVFRVGPPWPLTIATAAHHRQLFHVTADEASRRIGGTPLLRKLMQRTIS